MAIYDLQRQDKRQKNKPLCEVLTIYHISCFLSIPFHKFYGKKNQTYIQVNFTNRQSFLARYFSYYVGKDGTDIAFPYSIGSAKRLPAYHRAVFSILLSLTRKRKLFLIQIPSYNKTPAVYFKPQVFSMFLHYISSGFNFFMPNIFLRKKEKNFGLSTTTIFISNTSNNSAAF